MGQLLGLAGLAAAVSVWWTGQKARERVLSAARARCNHVGVQLLDETVTLDGWGLMRGPGGTLRLWRRYGFEFSSTGDERYAGHVLMAAGRIRRIELDAHRLPLN